VAAAIVLTATLLPPAAAVAKAPSRAAADDRVPVPDPA
jgi:hypothetical protein